MTNYKYYLLYIIPLLTVLLMFSISGCSYVMDYIEGRITNRAAFSIVATYDPSDETVTIEWDEKGSGDDFAGYEIYITEEADDEYVGYTLAASYYDSNPHPNISSQSSNSLLKLNLTGSYTLNVSSLAASYPGIYFFRIGIIHWDVGDEEDRQEDYEGGVLWDTEPYRETNYNAHTSMNKVSGYAMVEIL